MVPLWNLTAHEGYAYHWDGLNTSLQRSRAVVGDRRRRDDEMGRSRLSRTGTAPIRRTMSSLRRIQNYIERSAAAEVSVRRSTAPSRPPARGLQDRSARRATHPAAAAPARSSRSTRSAPTAIGSTCGRQPRRPPTTPTATATPGSSRISRTTTGYVVGAARRHLAARRRTCTTARCRRLRPCSSRSIERPTKFWRGYDVYDPTRRRLRHATAPRPNGSARRSTCRCPGNSNAGHTYGVTLPARTQARADRVPEDALTLTRAKNPWRTQWLFTHSTAPDGRQPGRGTDAAGVRSSHRTSGSSIQRLRRAYRPARDPDLVRSRCRHPVWRGRQRRRRRVGCRLARSDQRRLRRPLRRMRRKAIAPSTSSVSAAARRSRSTSPTRWRSMASGAGQCHRRAQPSIRFLGLFDVVAAFGVANLGFVFAS